MTNIRKALGLDVGGVSQRKCKFGLRSTSPQVPSHILGHTLFGLNTNNFPDL